MPRISIGNQGILPFQDSQGNLRRMAGRLLPRIVLQGVHHTIRYREVSRPQSGHVTAQRKIPGSGGSTAADQHAAVLHPLAQRLFLFFRQARGICIVQDDHRERIQQFPVFRQGLRRQRHRLPVFITVQCVILLRDIQVRQVPGPGGEHADHHGGWIDDVF